MTRAPDLVLLHGALGARVQFGALVAALGSTFRVHTLDFEGHGSIPHRGRPFRMQHFAENVLEVLDRERIDRVSIFGYSMGGYVGLHLAVECPERIARVATLGTKFRWDPATAEREARRLDPAAIRAKVPGFAEALAVRHERAGGWERVVTDTAECLRDLGARRLLIDDTLGRIGQPVRVIVGDRDSTVSVDESAAAARAIAAGELAVLPRTTHPIEQLDLAKIVPVLTEFFAPPEDDTA